MRTNDIINRLIDSRASRLLDLVGARDAARWVYRRATEFTTADTRTITIDETAVRMQQETFVAKRALDALLDERVVLEDLLDRLSSDDVFFDIGAHHGIYSCAVNGAAPDATVVPFEPVQANVAKLQSNTALNHTSFPIKNCALADESGFIPMSLERQGESGQHRLGDRGESQIEVPAFTGDALIADGEVPPPTVAKIDVEGAEARVLDGLSDALEESMRLVYCEVHQGVSETDIVERLEQADFGVEWMDGVHERRVERFLRAT